MVGGISQLQQRRTDSAIVMEVQPQGHDSFHVEQPQQGHAQGQGDQLSAKVNFQPRTASIAQTLMAVLVWGGTVGLVIVLIWSSMNMNVKLRPSGTCIPCEPGFNAVGKADCPNMCISQGLLAKKLAKGCLGIPTAELAAAPIGPMTEWTQSLVATAHATALEEHQSGDSLAPAPILVRRLTQESLEAAVYRRLGDSVQNKSMMQLLASPYFLPALLPLLLAVATLWFALLRTAPHCAMWTTIGLFLIVLLYAYYLTQNWMMLVVAGAFAAWMGVNAANVNAGCSCLQGGLRALSESPKSLVVIVATTFVMLMYTALLIGTLVLNSQILAVVQDPDTEICHLMPASAQFSTVFVIMFLLISNFFTMAGTYSVSFAIGCWYFHRGDSQVPETPMATGLKMALFSRNGTGVCAQAGVVMTVVDYIESKTKESKCPCMDPMWCLMAALYCTMKQCLDSLCTFAVVAVALEGGPFCATSQLAKNTIGFERSARFLVINTSLGWLLELQAHALSTGFGILSLVAIDAIEGLGIFSSIINGASRAGEVDPASAQWIIVSVIVMFFWLMRRPLLTITTVILIYIYAGNLITWTIVNAILAALLVGCVGALTFHQFAQAATSSLSAMLYCWSLDQALCNGQAGHAACAEQVSEMMRQAVELQPNGVTAQPAQAMQGTVGVPVQTMQ